MPSTRASQRETTSRFQARPLFWALNSLTLAVALLLIFHAVAPSDNSFFAETDHRLHNLYRAHAFLEWKPVFEAGSFIGGRLLGFLVVAGAVWLYRLGARRQALALAISTLGAWAGATLLKFLFSSPRPRVREVTYAISGYGFPSAHAMVTLVFFGLFAFYLSREFRRGHLAIWGTMGLIVLWVGLSRVFLGSHWLSDVLAGYAFGLLWISGTLFSTKENRRPSPAVERSYP
ncbi:MAG TPA: phosphatase PAP2 family protein [Methylomirabilota bacterium]|nr:phosphatase PAP2 family protein [Methylomirabilota bacterium]